MKFEELTCCPFCGCDQYYEKQYARGPVIFRMRYDSEQADNSEMYDSIDFTFSGRVYCDNCDQYLGNRITSDLSVAARKALKKQLTITE